MKRAKQIKDPKTKNNIKIKQQPLSLRHRDQKKNNSHCKNFILEKCGSAVHISLTLVTSKPTHSKMINAQRQKGQIELIFKQQARCK